MEKRNQYSQDERKYQLHKYNHKKSKTFVKVTKKYALALIYWLLKIN